MWAVYTAGTILTVYVGMIGFLFSQQHRLQLEDLRVPPRTAWDKFCLFSRWPIGVGLILLAFCVVMWQDTIRGK